MFKFRQLMWRVKIKHETLPTARNYRGTEFWGDTFIYKLI